MTTDSQTFAPGWYPDPVHGVGQRYWNEQWTEHVLVSGQQYVSPLPVVATVAPKKKIYWSNLLRFRVWWFSLVAPIFILFLLSLVGFPPSISLVLYPFVAVGIMWFWMYQQMACGHCGTALRVTRLSGPQRVCHKCGAPTD